MFLLYCFIGFFLGMYLVKLTKQQGRFNPEWEGSTLFMFILISTFMWPFIVLYIITFSILEVLKK